MKKKLPPFGKQLKMKMLQGWQPTNGINIYTSWTMGRAIPHGVTFPPEADPYDYDWSLLAGQDISLINTESYVDYKILKWLAVVLIQSGAKRVGLIDVEHPLQWYVPEVKGVAV